MNSPFDGTFGYLNYLFSIRSPIQVWLTFLLVLARLIPIFSIPPFLGGRLLPSPIKLGITIVLAILCFPQILTESYITNPIEDWLYILLLIKEVILGCIIGFLVAFPFYAVQSSGSFVSNQKGIQGLEGATSPISMEQTSPHSILYQNIATIAFWSSGGLSTLLVILMHSFKVIPVHAFIPPTLMSLKIPMWVTIIKLSHICLLTTIQLGAPSTLAMLLSDLFLGIINRMAPQVQVIYLLSALKAFMGTLFLWIAWVVIIKQIDVFVIAWFYKLKEHILNF